MSFLLCVMQTASVKAVVQYTKTAGEERKVKYTFLTAKKLSASKVCSISKL